MEAKKTYRLILADDHPLIRAGLKMLLKGYKEFNVIAEAQDGEQAITLLEEHHPDFIVLDIDMPGKSGIEVAEYVMKTGMETRIIFLTSHSSFSTFSEALKFHYSGFVFKESALDEMVLCLRTLIDGKIYISELFKKFVEQNQGEVKRFDELKERYQSLTSTEKKILKLISEGKTTPQIASLLFNSEKTIENHRYNMCIKLKVKGSNNLLAFALENRQILKNLEE